MENLHEKIKKHCETIYQKGTTKTLPNPNKELDKLPIYVTK